MDFHSLLRRDLQFLCKINKIPANMTNIAMADALKSLETVEGLDEYMNQSDSNVLQSPTSVAKLPPSTATRATRRKTAVKPEPRSSRLASKFLDGELDQENTIKNVKLDVAKTPAARSTRKASAATSCTSKAQESKKGDLVQSAYSTRRSTRLLEKCMADLSLKTKETYNPERIEEAEQEVSTTQEKNPAGSEERTEDAAVILGRDLSASMEKEWDVLKNDDDTPVLEHANTETTSDNTESKNLETFESLVQVHHQVPEEAIQEKDSEPEKTNNFHEETMVDQTDGDSEADSNHADHQEIEVASKENDSEAEKITTFDGDSESEQEGDDSGIDSDGTISEADSNQVDHQVPEEAMQEKDSEPEKTNTFHEETMVDQTDGDSEADSNHADHREIEVATQENDSEAEKINTFVEDTLVETDGDSESEQEGDDSGIDSDGTISEADSNQVDHQETEHATEENDFEAEKINTFVEDTMVEQKDGDSETESEGDDSGVDSDGTISEADSYQAIQGSDIADEKKIMIPESEGSVTVPTSALVLEEALVETTPLSPFVAESISAQFPRPNKSASKNSAMKLVNVDNKSKENSMEMMMNVVNGESKGKEAAKKNKKVEFDEENLKDVSMRQLVKMVKKLSIKSSSNRTALQMLPGNNQIAE
ncbi:Uncharacterized protein Rs2_46918 [Raphanus sativus]|uniref:Uncharacterized protein LOC108844244 n=1 Tax=Raphanus sativus TaxID=3726 RepID=A0A6J0MN75_RAPSA|nr:uncharacterized protein LOC108844244 [Raphanus sativus]KAJ4871447.1 Uncharacterized protein Rs2_46918 [Raphanus sativus]